MRFSCSSLRLLVLDFLTLEAKLTNWDGFEAGMAPLIIIVSFLGAIQLFAIGFMHSLYQRPFCIHPVP